MNHWADNPTPALDPLSEPSQPRGIEKETAGLDVRNLSVTYETETGPLPILRNISMRIRPGDIYGFVGESGSGKTTLARALVRYLPDNGRITSGEISLDDVNLLGLSKKAMRRVWGSKITMVHQDPNKAVNPSMVIGAQIAEIARAHLGMSKSQARQKAIEMLTSVRMADPDTVAKRYPHQLSGGQLQRVLIAIALTTNPRLLIMDEPTTALDVTTEAVILDLVRDLLAEYNTAVLFITHNLGVVARLCHRVGVIYAGEMMEEGSVRQVFKAMRHPYTLGLLRSVPRIDKDKREIVLNTIPGFIPRCDKLPAGCIFAPRCAGAEAACEKRRPPLVAVDPSGGHMSACRRWQMLATAPETFTPVQNKPAPGSEDTGKVILQATHIKKYFRVPKKGLRELFRRRQARVRAVDDITLRIPERFTLGIVGESGCGKTTLARCIAGLETATEGELQLEKRHLPAAISDRPPQMLQKIQMVFQNPDASLNPHYTVGYSVARPLALLGKLSAGKIRKRVRQLFQAVNLPVDYIDRLPHQLSGGEKQRVAIARAAATHPELMICDEPISSLDVSVQASLMNLLADLQQSQGASYLFISHDLAAVRHLSDAIAVIYLGRLWEVGPAHAVFAPPYHPYTEALLSALPIPDPDAGQSRIRLRGNVPSSMDIPAGCRFHTRCPRKIGAACEQREPEWQTHIEGHKICCHIPLAELAKLQTTQSA